MKGASRAVVYGFLMLLLVMSAGVLLSCGGGGGGVATEEGVSLQGRVADGYVSGATVTVYSDAGMTTQIGSGSTDTEGRFNISLSVSSIPQTVYIKASGGIDVETGMPAPTMLFVGSGGLSNFVISPLTDSLYDYFIVEGTLNGAITNLTGRLGISDTELYEDPEVSLAAAGGALNALAGGTMEGTLPAGTYNGVVIFFEQGNIGTNNYPDLQSLLSMNRLYMTLIVNADGSVGGQIEGSTEVVRGRVHGSTILLDVVDDPASPTEITRVAGTIGLLGSVGGVYTHLSTSLERGIFVASFRPAGSSVDIGGIANLVASTFAGERYFLARDMFGDPGDGKRVAWGNFVVQDIDVAAGAVELSAMPVAIDNGSYHDPNDPAMNQTFLFNSSESAFLNSANGLPENIVVLTYDKPDPWGGGNVFIVQPVGMRRAIYLVTDSSGVATGAGEAYTAKPTQLAPSLKSNTSYQIAVAVAHPGLLNQPRADMINATDPNDPERMPYLDAFTTGDISGASFINVPDAEGKMLIVFGGGNIMAMKNDDNDDGLLNGVSDPDANGEPDFIRMVQFYETGAFEGEQMIGGQIDTGAGSEPASTYPATFVGIANASGTTPPSFTGTLNFLARTLYASDYNDYAGAYVWGSLQISGTGTGQAELDFSTAGGDSGTDISLDVGYFMGLYHVHGALGSEYLDIFWPVGGKKAVYIVSEGGLILSLIHI